MRKFQRTYFYKMPVDIKVAISQEEEEQIRKEAEEEYDPSIEAYTLEDVFEDMMLEYAYGKIAKQAAAYEHKNNRELDADEYEDVIEIT